MIAGRVRQIRGDARAVAGTKHRAFHDRVHFQLARAISGNGFFAPLYRITEVREMTRRALILAKSVISSSVTPSAKYSCSGSPEWFA
jgi:hypothetical protein